ncbi:MAG TPA: ATP-dependent helicase, partial [Blastocatellia bacterium]|nr:ATP-dependent helicase [Blastocatellia bacterium]
LIHEDMRYRDKQLLRLREEVLDLEDFSESVALNEFTLDDFRIELSNYITSNRKLLEDAPLGLYGVVPPHPEQKAITPGVVFCFKQKGSVTSGETVNPLQPYYLVYVLNDGTVRFSFAQPKQVLEIYRLLCSGKAAAYDHLCQLFDSETQNGSDMSLYNKLLDAAVESIARTFQKRMAAGLQTGRDFKIPDEQEQAREASDLELVTWLVIKTP